ncbi:uncharacterized protein TNCT_58671 [Trichonephila clavata]|uniref:Uncharacterized protein n=1 Tax=Trichonephila clavata TaxID=2740835 RepID=A0A8X6HXL4_TRICU|nr:uncharacterized protein TNCT_58671 [Trichonephila clavata]
MECNCIVVLRRKVPYCIQDFFHRLHTKKYLLPSSPSQFFDIRAEFEDEWLPMLKKHGLEDYKRYLNGEYFEDLYDFPHGQLRSKLKEDISTIELFNAAYREFQEETGFHFKFTKEEVERYPLVTSQYKGLDGFLYKQNYFIVNNVRGLKRHAYFNSFNKSSTAKGQITSWNDDRLIYQGIILPIEVAYRRVNSVIPAYESYGSDRNRRGPFLDLYNSPRYPFHRYVLTEEFGSENDHYNAHPPTRPRSPVEQTSEALAPTEQDDTRRWLPRIG